MSGFNFDAFIFLMEASLAFFAILAVILTGLMVLVRVRRSQLDRRRTWLHARWRPFFANETVRTGDLPVLESRDMMTVLLLWSSMRPAHGAHMDEVARALGLDRYARQLLVSKDDGDRVAALDALGWLGDELTNRTARELIDDSDGRISQTAAQALLRMRPRESIETVVGEIRSNVRWMRRRSEAMLAEAGADVVDPAMHKLILEAPPSGQATLFNYIRACSPETIRATALDVINGGPDDIALAAALRALSLAPHPSDAALARTYLDRPRPFVQLAALRVLSKTGGAEDTAHLQRLTMNQDWWVRRRAAQLLAELAPTAAADILHQTTDEFARDALEHALAGRTS